jgi:hypothetical protein
VVQLEILGLQIDLRRLTGIKQAGNYQTKSEYPVFYHSFIFYCIEDDLFVFGILRVAFVVL